VNITVPVPVIIFLLSYLQVLYGNIRSLLVVYNNYRFFSFIFCHKNFSNFLLKFTGKGAMDGIGAVLKRTADRLVSQQRDITTVEQFLEEVSPACPGVCLYEIPDQHFQQIQEWMPKTIPSVPSIMKMHQVVWSERQKSHLFLGELSCFECLEVCSHHCLNKGVIQTLSSTSVSPFLGCILYFI